jgi:poly-gamma-glutamate synthesis protein (capsule biosynthesis protein)
MRRRVFQRSVLATLLASAVEALPCTTGSATAMQQPEDPGRITLFLGGDVMTGRGIDQILPDPVDPILHEPFVTSALDYVALAEQANGTIPRPVDLAYIWGAALVELDRVRPDLRIVNLETSVTRSDTPYPKGINYRMSPANVGCLTAAGIDGCALANNHVLDWGEPGLAETLASLRRAGLRAAGAGLDLAEAEAPVILEVPGKGRVIMLAFGTRSSGIPPDWAASPGKAGVRLLPDFGPATVGAIGAQLRALKRSRDVAVASIHWGGNWGYRIAADEIAFAHALIDEAGVDLVHGHSSHHAKALEIHRGRLILYGCGDFLNDYEGIAGHEDYRDDLPLMYFPTLDAASGALLGLTMTPLRIRRFRLEQAPEPDRRWLADRLSREGRRFGTAVRLEPDGTLSLQHA